MDEARTETVDQSLKAPVPLGIRLLVLVGPDSGQELEVRDGTVLVGTHTDCQMRLTDGGVSRRHLSLELFGSKVRVVDLDSKNGTRYLGAKVSRIELPLGASIELGSTTLALLPLLRRETLSDKQALGKMIGRSLPMRRLFAQIEQLAPTDASCLLQGETGTGKELAAQTIHALSPRATGPFVTVDCGSLTSALVSSTLFGHVKGAFTGAVKDNVGLIEAAHGGTLFLDEVNALPLELQPMLLRVLESGTFQRVGDGQRRSVDFRIMASTSQNLEQEVSLGRVRSDLYYRLASITLYLPPLRERLEDVALLARHFANLAGAKAPLSVAMIPELSGWRWPGNVRELKNAVERVITLGDLHTQLGAEKKEDFHQARDKALTAFERSYLEALLIKHQGSASAIAREAGIARSYLYRLFQAHGLMPDDYRTKN